MAELFNRIASRYAQAFYDFSKERNILEQSFDNLRFVQNLVKTSDELQNFFLNPLIRRSKKRKIVDKLFREHIAPETYHFLNFLVDKGRMEFIKDVVRCFERIYNLDHNILKASIVSAKDIDSDHQKLLTLKLEKKLKATIKPEFKTNPDLIGGFRVSIQDRIFDLSVAYQLEQIKNNISEV